MTIVINHQDKTVSSKALADRKPTAHTDMIRSIKQSFMNIGQNLDEVTALHQGIQVLRDDRGYVSEILLSVKNAVFVVSKWDDSLRMLVMYELEASKVISYSVLEAAPLAITMAKAFGFTGNQALLSADRATKSLTGYSPLELMGQTKMI